MTSATPAKRPDVRVALEKLLREGQARNERKVFRDRRRRVVLVHESALDPDKLLKAGRSLTDVGRRIRHYDAAMKQDNGPWIVPAELAQLSREEPEAVAGLELPLGTIVAADGLWLKYRPGIEEIGVSDRGELVLRETADADPASGPVRNALHTAWTGQPARIIARTAPAEFEADRKEVEMWLKLLATLDGKRTQSHAFKCAGIDFQHRGNVAHLHRSAQLAFFDLRDIDMVRIASLLAFRFRKVKRKPPSVMIISLGGVPRDAAAWNGFQKRLKNVKKPPAGLPQKLVDSRFFDPQSKTVGPCVVVLMRPLRELPEEIVVLTVNTDDHEELKGRAVLSSLMAILTPVDMITARGGIAVLSSEGTATTFTGPTGTGRSTGCLFWSSRDEKVRRRELRRRYETDLRKTPDAGRLGEAGIQKELDRLLGGIGVLCQEDSAEILKEGAGQWTFWPTERVLHAATASFPGLGSVHQENGALLENVLADFGACGRTTALGRVTHRYPLERVYYDPAWNHLVYDRSSRRIAANVILQKDPASDVLVRRIPAREATERLLVGQTPDGGYEPLFNANSDLSGVLMQAGVVGPRLVEAYDAAQRGDYAPLGNGDAALGEALFDRLDAQVKLWLDNCRETPTWLVNTAWGLELTQDVHWMLAQHADAFAEGKPLTNEQFRSLMRDRYGVTYGARGEWTHIPADERLD